FSRITLNICLILLRICFEQAIADGVIEANPANGVKLRREGDKTDKWTFLKPDEQHALATCKDIPEPDRLRILFAMYTGIRQREQWCLPPDDVRMNDPTGPHIIVRYGAPGRAT